MEQSPVITESHSYLTPYGYQSGSCGYCKAPSTSQRTPKSRGSFYAHSNRLTVDHYQTLVDRGWRRSGETLYKPDQIRSCCPHYTIRLPMSEIRISRGQRQTVNRWNRFVLGDEYIKESAILHPKSKEEKRRQSNEFDLVSTIHESEYANLKTPPAPQHRFEITLESTQFSEEKYALFEQYQRLVHKEPPSRVSKAGFERFLCNTPLVNSSCEVDGQVRVFGSRHQCYRFDGKLIAIGVIDLLPRAVSAVYFIYDVEFEKHSFGKLSALREGALALEGGYQYYNMGYYIHSCPKMRYKCDYKPQYLLDPDTYKWDVLDDDFKAKLDANKFVSLSRDHVANGQTGTNKATINANAALSSAGSEKYRTATEAEASGESMLTFHMPGIMSASQVALEMAVHAPLVAFGKGTRRILPASALNGWKESTVTDPESLKCAVGELVACVGVDVAREMVAEF